MKVESYHILRRSKHNRFSAKLDKEISQNNSTIMTISTRFDYNKCLWMKWHLHVRCSSEMKLHLWFLHLAGQSVTAKLCIKVYGCKTKCCWVWHRLIAALTHQLLPSYGRQRVGVAASLQTAGAEAGRWTKKPLPPSLPVPALSCQLAAPAATQW